FLKAFRAAFSCSFAGGVGGGTSSVMITSAKGKLGRRAVGQTISRPPGAGCVVGPFRKVNPSAPKLPVPARDVQRFAGDPRRVGRRQEHGRGRDVLRLPDPPQRRLRLDLLAEVTLGDPGGVYASGLDHAGVDRIDADLARPE